MASPLDWGAIPQQETPDSWGALPFQEIDKASISIPTSPEIDSEESPGSPFIKTFLSSLAPLSYAASLGMRQGQKVVTGEKTIPGAFREGVSELSSFVPQFMAGAGKAGTGILSDLALTMGGQPTTENIRAGFMESPRVPLPIESQLEQMPGFMAGAAQGLVGAAKSVPALVGGAALSTFMSPFAAFPLAFGTQTFGETGDVKEAAKSAAVAALFPVIGKAAKPIGVALGKTLVEKGIIQQGNETALKATEGIVEQTMFQAAGQLMNTPAYIKATPEERKKLFAETTASLSVFALPTVLRTFNSRIPSETTTEEIKKSFQEKTESNQEFKDSNFQTQQEQSGERPKDAIQEQQATQVLRDVPNEQGAQERQRQVPFPQNSPEVQQASEILLRTDTEFPDFQSSEVSKSFLTRKFGAENIPIIGKLFGPRGNYKNPVEESIGTYRGELGIGRAISSAFGEQINGSIDPLFLKNERGEILNIGLTNKGQSRFISDVFESLQKDPNSYILNPEQRQSFNRITDYFSKLKELEDKYEIFQDEGGDYQPGKPIRREGYFPRIVTSRPPEDVGRTGGGSRPGSKQFFQKSRMFQSEEEGVSNGYGYEPSIEKRLVTRAERLYKAIADKRLAKDPSLGGTTRSQLLEDLREGYAEEIGSGQMTEAKLESIANSLSSKGTVYQPAFFGMIFTPETANSLNKAFPNADTSFRRNWVKVNNALKGFRLSFDFGAPLLQGLPTLFRNPVIWKDAVVSSLKAFADPSAFPGYVNKNLPFIREMAQLGSSVGRLPEMLAGLEEKELLSRVPGARAFGRNFQTFLDVAKVELWKSKRDITPKEDWGQVIQSIESQLLSSRMESIGLSDRRVLLERALFLAPSYYRGAVNLIGELGQANASGKMARQAVGSYLAGGLLTYVGIAAGLGMTEDEITERLNPAKSDFMMWDYKADDGRTVKIGLGGIYRSMLRLAGNVVKTSVEHPENWESLSSEKNPFVRWYRGHAAPVPGIVWDAFSGRDFMESETDVTTVLGSTVPLVGQQLLRESESFRREGEPDPKPIEYVTTFLGLSSFPSSLSQEKEQARNDISQKNYNKPYGELYFKEMVKVTDAVDKLPQFSNQEYSLRAKQYALKNREEQKKRIFDSLNQKEQLKQLGLDVTGFESSITFAGKDIPLSKEQRESMELKVIEEYNRVLTSDFINKIMRLSDDQMKNVLNHQLNTAKEIARKRTIQEINNRK